MHTLFVQLFARVIELIDRLFEINGEKQNGKFQFFSYDLAHLLPFNRAMPT